MKKSHLLTLLVTSFIYTPISHAQCVADETAVFSFDGIGSSYQIVKENKTWAEAAACAVERGGVLAIVNDSDENSLIFNAAFSAGVVPSSTVAPDGGGGAYLWLGGTDKATEGKWLWDGNNDDTGSQFWEGDASGSPVGGLYNAWGDEPDDFGSGQDALGISLDGWPLGDASEWNDVDRNNTLYYVIELPADDASINGLEKVIELIYPNPSKDIISIKIGSKNKIKGLKIYDLGGKEVMISEELTNHTIDISSLKNGTYIVEIKLENGTILNEKITKQ